MNFIPRALERFEADFSIRKAAIIIAVLTLVSRASGLLRTRLFTSTFGAGETLDIYYAAFRIPDFIINLLILGTLTVAFLPVFTKYMVRSRKEAYDLASNMLTVAFIGVSVVCFTTYIFLEPLTKWLVPGFSHDQMSQTIILTRLILFAQIIFAVSSLYTTILNAHKRFIIAALAPIIYNLGIIIGVVFFYPRFGLAGLGYGVIFGSLLHLTVQLLEAARLGFMWKPRLRVHQGLKATISLYVPRIFFIDLSQVSLLIASVLGSFLIAGSITVFNLAFDIQAVATGVFAISTAIAVFPVLSESFASNNKRRFWDALSKSISQILFFVIPISIGILIFRAYIVRILFGTGAFNWEDTIATFEVLGIFSFALFSQALLPLFSRALYARHNTTTPMIVGLVCIVVNIAVSYTLAPTLGISGVAYGFTAASILNAIILYVIIRSILIAEEVEHPHMAHNFETKVSIDFIKVVIASLSLGVVSFVALRAVAPFVDTRTGFGILVQSGLAAGLGGVAFLIVSYYLELEESRRIIDRLKSILKRLH